MSKRLAISICGPSGSGKTTAVGILSEFLAPYVESPENNPHFNRDQICSSKHNVFLSQDWFLANILSFIESNRNISVVIDQSPEGIVYAYSKYFLNCGQLSVDEFIHLQDKMEFINLTLKKHYIYKIINLNAEPEILHKRVCYRDSAGSTPPLSWFIDSHSRFNDIEQGTMDDLSIDTSSTTVAMLSEKITKHVTNWMAQVQEEATPEE